MPGKIALNTIQQVMCRRHVTQFHKNFTIIEIHCYILIHYEKCIPTSINMPSFGIKKQTNCVCLVKLKPIAAWYVLTCNVSLSITQYVTWSREMSHLSKISIPIFLHLFLITTKCLILMQTPLHFNIWLQSYEGYVNAKNNIKQRNLNTVFANISKTTSPTSNSFLLIMSHIQTYSHYLVTIMHITSGN